MNAIAPGMIPDTASDTASDMAPYASPDAGSDVAPDVSGGAAPGTGLPQGAARVQGLAPASAAGLSLRPLAAPAGPAGGMARAAGAPGWLVSFADLVALLIAFFAMMLAMSSFAPGAVSRLPHAVPGAAGLDRTAGVEAWRQEADAPGAGARYLARVLADGLAALGYGAGGGGGDVRLEARMGGAVVIFPAAALAAPVTGAEFSALLARLEAAAPGRVSHHVGAPDGLAGVTAWRERLARARARAPGPAVGIAGWLAPDEAAVAIADRAWMAQQTVMRAAEVRR